LNGVQIQKFLEILYGMPIETEINIPQAAFEVTPRAFLKCQYRDKNRVLLMKNKNSWNFKTIRDCRVLPNAFTFCGIQLYRAGSANALGAKPSDGVFWTDFSSIGYGAKH
jgi:hypothetical protein